MFSSIRRRRLFSRDFSIFFSSFFSLQRIRCRCRRRCCAMRLTRDQSLPSYRHQPVFSLFPLSYSLPIPRPICPLSRSWTCRRESVDVQPHFTSTTLLNRASRRRKLASILYIYRQLYSPQAPITRATTKAPLPRRHFLLKSKFQNKIKIGKARQRTIVVFFFLSYFSDQTLAQRLFLRKGSL